jgi:hypothetical protein
VEGKDQGDLGSGRMDYHVDYGDAEKVGAEERHDDGDGRQVADPGLVMEPGRCHALQFLATICPTL